MADKKNTLLGSGTASSGSNRRRFSTGTAWLRRWSPVVLRMPGEHGKMGTPNPYHPPSMGLVDLPIHGWCIFNGKCRQIYGPYTTCMPSEIIQIMSIYIYVIMMFLLKLHFLLTITTVIWRHSPTWILRGRLNSLKSPCSFWQGYYLDKLDEEKSHS